MSKNDIKVHNDGKITILDLAKENPCESCQDDCLTCPFGDRSRRGAVTVAPTRTVLVPPVDDVIAADLSVAGNMTVYTSETMDDLPEEVLVAIETDLGLRDAKDLEAVEKLAEAMVRGYLPTKTKENRCRECGGLIPGTGKRGRPAVLCPACKAKKG